MDPQTIDLSAGFVPKAQQPPPSVDISAGIVPKGPNDIDLSAGLVVPENVIDHVSLNPSGIENPEPPKQPLRLDLGTPPAKPPTPAEQQLQQQREAKGAPLVRQTSVQTPTAGPVPVVPTFQPVPDQTKLAPSSPMPAADAVTAPHPAPAAPHDIRARESGFFHPLNYLEDVVGDVRYGQDSTLPGAVLKKMGAQGTSKGVPEQVGETFGGPVIGPLRAAHGLGEMADAPIEGLKHPLDVDSARAASARGLRGANEAVSGAMQAAAIPAAATSPEFLPEVVKYGLIQNGIEKGLQKLGVSPEASQAVANLAILAPSVHQAFKSGGEVATSRADAETYNHLNNFRDVVGKAGIDVPENPTWAEAEKAYKQAMSKLHPDVNSDAGTSAQDLNVAYSGMKAAQGVASARDVAGKQVVSKQQAESLGQRISAAWESLVGKLAPRAPTGNPDANARADASTAPIVKQGGPAEASVPQAVTQPVPSQTPTPESPVSGKDAGSTVAPETPPVGATEPETDRTVVQPTDKLAEAQKLATAAAPELEQKLSAAIDPIQGAEVAGIRREKDSKRSMEKIRKEDKPVETLPDLLAARVSVDSPEAKDQVVNALKRQFPNIVKEEDAFDKGDPDYGFRAQTLQVQMSNGSSAEVQIVPKDILAVADETHTNYEKGRKAEISGDTQGAQAAMAANKAVHDAAMQRFTDRAAMTKAVVPQEHNDAFSQAVAESGKPFHEQNAEERRATINRSLELKDGKTPVAPAKPPRRGEIVILPDGSSGKVESFNPNMDRGSVVGQTKSYRSGEMTPMAPVDLGKAKTGSELETALAKRTKEQGPQLVAKYLVENTKDGVVYIGTDRAKSLFPEYVKDPTKTGEDVGQAGAAVAHAAWETAISNPPAPGKDVVRVLTGAPASGKTTAALGGATPENVGINREAILQDVPYGTQLVDQALASGRTPDIHLFYTNDPTINVQRMVERAKQIGRTVPVDYMAKAFVEVPKTVAALETKYGSRINVTAIDNTDKPVIHVGTVQPATEATSKWTEQSTREAMRGELERLHSAGEVPENIYQAAGGGKVESDAARSVPGERGSERGGHREEQGQVVQLKPAESEKPTAPPSGGVSAAPTSQKPPTNEGGKQEEPTKYKFGNTQADIPDGSAAAKALEELRSSIPDADLAGNGKDVGGNHITVRYGIKGDDTDGIRAFIEKQAPFEASLGPTSKFPVSEHSEGAAPIIAPIKAPELHRLNAEMEQHGDFAPSSFPEYRPHATVAYVKAEAADKYVGLKETDGKTFRVESISITKRDGSAESIKLKGETKPAAVETKESAAETSKPKSEAAPRGQEAGEVVRIPVHDLVLDPKRFQYKLNTDETGVTGLLKGRRWNDDLAGIVSVWRDPANGKTYVVNGHHRVQLARENSVSTINVRYIDAPTAAAARATGALQNVAEGRGTAVDAAKFFRDSAYTPDKLEELGISMGEATASRGLALAKLAPVLFDEVVRGEMGIGRGVAIGEATENPEQQQALIKLIAKKERTGRAVTTDTLTELARMVRGAGEHTETQDSLFGAMETTRNLALEKAEVSSYIRARIGQEKRLFSNVSDEGKAVELGKAGNTINAQENARIAKDAAQAQELYDRLSTRSGTIDGILNRAASGLAKGESANGVKERAYEESRTALAEALRGRAESEHPGVQETANPVAAPGNEVALPGLEEHVARQHEAAAAQRGEDLTRELQSPAENINKAAGEMERNSPLFEGSDANPQAGLFGKSTKLYSTPFDPELFKAYILDPALEAAKPLREALARNAELSATATSVQKELYHALRSETARSIRAGKRIESLLTKSGFTAEDGRQVYRHMEDQDVKLTPKQEELRDQWIKPLNKVADRQRKIAKLIQSGKFPLDDILNDRIPEVEVRKYAHTVPNYMHRIAQGQGSMLDWILGGDKKSFGKRNILSKAFSSGKRAVFQEARGPNGEREAVAIKGGRVTQFVTDHAEIDRQLAATQGKIVEEQRSTQPDQERIAKLNQQLVDLNQKRDLVTQGRPATLDLGGYYGHFVTPEDLLNEDIAGISKKIGKLELAMRVLSRTVPRNDINDARLQSLNAKIADLRAQQQAIKQEFSPETLRDRAVTRGELLEKAVAPLERKLGAMKLEWETLTTNPQRWAAAMGRTDTLYNTMADLEQQVAAIRVSITPESVSEKLWYNAKTGKLEPRVSETEGATRQDVLRERLEPVNRQIARLRQQQKELERITKRTPKNERDLARVQEKLSEAEQQKDEISEQHTAEGMQGRYWRDKFGRLWQFNRGTTDFITKRTGQRYFDNAILSSEVNYLEASRAANASVTIERQKQMLLDAGLAMEPSADAAIPDGWKSSYLPQMRSMHFPAHIADAYDQFADQTNRGTSGIIERVNRFNLGLVLVNPLMHGKNIASQWVTGKLAEGISSPLRLFSPTRWAANGQAGIRAVNAVTHVNEDYLRALENGLDLLKESVHFDAGTTEAIKALADHFGADEADAAVWKKALGIPGKVSDFIHGLNHELTFGMNDVFLLQSYFSALDRFNALGLPNAEDAARDWAHNQVLEYRPPVRFAGSRSIARVLENPSIVAFWRYHSDLLRQTAQAVKDAAGAGFEEEDENGQNRFGETKRQTQARGMAKLAVMAAFAIALYPLVLDPLAKELTGDIRAKAPRGGMMGIASDVYEMTQGDRSPGQVARSIFTPALGSENLAQLLLNTDFFTGRNIVDVHGIKSGDVPLSAGGRQLGDWIESRTAPGQMHQRIDRGQLSQVLFGLAGFTFPTTGAMKEAIELRRQATGKAPVDLRTQKIWQSMYAAIEEYHSSNGQKHTIEDHLLESGLLSKHQEADLEKGMEEPPIVFAVRGFPPKDVYAVFQKASPEEKRDLLGYDESGRKLYKYVDDLAESENAADRQRSRQIEQALSATIH